jgi:hypothetical protein
VLAIWRPYQRDEESPRLPFPASFAVEYRNKRERPIGSLDDGSAGRADIIVAESVLIEMKRGVTTSTARKALGQIKMYMRGWSQRTDPRAAPRRHVGQRRALPTQRS